MHFLSEKIRIFHFSGLHVSTAYQNFCSLYFSGINTLFIISIISIILIFFLHHQFDLYHHLYIHRNQAHILSKLVSGLVIAIRQSTRWSTACFQGPPHNIFIIFRNIFKVLLIIWAIKWCFIRCLLFWIFPKPSPDNDIIIKDLWPAMAMQGLWKYLLIPQIRSSLLTNIPSVLTSQFFYETFWWKVWSGFLSVADCAVFGWRCCRKDVSKTFLWQISISYSCSKSDTIN